MVDKIMVNVSFSIIGHLLLFVLGSHLDERLFQEFAAIKEITYNCFPFRMQFLITTSHVLLIESWFCLWSETLVAPWINKSHFTYIPHDSII